MKTPLPVSLSCLLLLLIPLAARGQVNSGSTGADGAFNPTTNTVVDLSDHPTGIYHYTAVNIPTGVTVTFIPNANNTPVTWLVRSNVVINGQVDVSGRCGNGIVPGQGGPGGGAGGYGGQGASPVAHRGAGLGGGDAAQGTVYAGGSGSYATVGELGIGDSRAASGLTYGNKFLLPLVGGSGGGGGYSAGGSGGGGAILIASDISILVDGLVSANGGCVGSYDNGGGGSGGAVRLVAPQILGRGNLIASGGGGSYLAFAGRFYNSGGSGFVRLDVLDDQFLGTLNDSASRGFNPILIEPGKTSSLAIQSIAGNAIPSNPTGALSRPDAVLSAQQNNPVSIVVRCTNLPLNTPVTVTVKPANGATISAVGYNTSGTLASSTATVSLNMPRGGGLIYATAATAP